MIAYLRLFFKPLSIIDKTVRLNFLLTIEPNRGAEKVDILNKYILYNEVFSLVDNIVILICSRAREDNGPI